MRLDKITSQIDIAARYQLPSISIMTINRTQVIGALLLAGLVMLGLLIRWKFSG